MSLSIPIRLPMLFTETYFSYFYYKFFQIYFISLLRLQYFICSLFLFSAPRSVLFRYLTLKVNVRASIYSHRYIEYFYDVLEQKRKCIKYLRISFVKKHIFVAVTAYFIFTLVATAEFCMKNTYTCTIFIYIADTYKRAQRE